MNHCVRSLHSTCHGAPVCGHLSQDEQHCGKASPFILGGPKNCNVGLRRVRANTETRLELGRSGHLSEDHFGAGWESDVTGPKGFLRSH